MLKKTSLLSLLLLSSVVTSTAFAAPSNLKKSPLKITLEEYSDVYAGVKFQYLDLNDRLLIVNNLLQSIELDYALLDYKEKVMGISFKEIKEKAIAREHAATDVFLEASQRKDSSARAKVVIEQAEKNMAFLDRMKIIIADFRDTHFYISENIPRPQVYNGLIAVEADGKILVSRINTRVLSRVDALTDAGVKAIKVGDEIVEIDGVPVQDKIDEIKKYIGGSTEAFIQSEAVYYLMIRNFAYPTKSSMTVTFANGAKYKLPYFANMSKSDMPRLDAISYFNNVGIEIDLTSSGLEYDSSTERWNRGAFTFDGYRSSKLDKNLKGLKEYISDSGSVGMRTGYYMQKGQTFAFMQLLTFATQDLTIKGEKKKSFTDAIREFAQDAKENELPVILDLRNNGGGNAALPARLLSIFTPRSEAYGAPSRGMRMTSYSRNLNEASFYQALDGENVSYGITYDDLRGLLNDAIDERKVYPPMYNMTGVITADPIVRGFDNDMVVLVSPDCVSACDMAVSLFNSSGRALLVGTHSNGTGAGYSTTSNLNTTWGDPLKQLKTNIPNFLFGKAHSDIERTIYEEDSVYDLCSENKPTVAHLHYKTTEMDVKTDNKGWLMAAAEVLNRYSRK